MGERIAGIIVFLMFGVPIIGTGIGILYYVCKAIVRGTKNTINNNRRKRQNTYVQDNSVLLKKLDEINCRYQFDVVEPKLNYLRKCKSKAEYDRLDLKEYLSIVVSEKNSFFRKMMKETTHNKETLKKYEIEYQSIISKIDVEGLGAIYKTTELEQLDNKRLKPTTEIEINVRKEYTSPKGTKCYHNSSIFSLDIVSSLLVSQAEEKKKKMEYKAMVDYERALMTNSLRYEIMQRDKFKCVLCGATVKDGIKLHVDHIKPVSKGGKTEKENLRTLCDRCNLGKSDSFFEGENI